MVFDVPLGKRKRRYLNAFYEEASSIRESYSRERIPMRNFQGTYGSLAAKQRARNRDHETDHEMMMKRKMKMKKNSTMRRTHDQEPKTNPSPI
jgi:hypothetical protein